MVISKKLAQKLLPNGFDNFFFEVKVAKYFTFVVVFIKLALLFALFTFVLALTPVRKTIEFI